MPFARSSLSALTAVALFALPLAAQQTFSLEHVRRIVGVGGVQLSPDVPDYYNSNGSPGHHLWDQIAVVDSTIRTIIGGQGGYGSFIGAQRFAYLGNVVSDSSYAPPKIAASSGVKIPS